MASIKTTNAVISYLLEYGDSPRIDIAKALSLTKASVTLVTNDMINKGVIVEQGEMFDETKKNIRGRRKILLSINPDYKVTIGVALLDNNIIIGVTNLNGDVFAKKKIEFIFTSYDELVDRIIKEINLILTENLINIEDILAAGIVLSKSNKKIIIGNSLDDELAKFKADISKKVNYSVVVGTIAKSCLLAQRVFNNVKTPDSMMLLSLIADVDIGLCVNSKFFNGRNNISGGSLLIENAINKFYLDNDTNALTDTIALCLSVLDLHNVYAFGGLLDDTNIIEQINKKLGNHTKINPPIMNKDTLFLAGCGKALFECLVV